MRDIILLFPLTLYSWLFFTPAKMSPIILNNIPAHYPGLVCIVNVLGFKGLKYLLCQAGKHTLISSHLSETWTGPFLCPRGKFFYWILLKNDMTLTSICSLIRFNLGLALTLLDLLDSPSHCVIPNKSWSLCIVVEEWKKSTAMFPLFTTSLRKHLWHSAGLRNVLFWNERTMDDLYFQATPGEKGSQVWISQIRNNTRSRNSLFKFTPFISLSYNELLLELELVKWVPVQLFSISYVFPV